MTEPSVIAGIPTACTVVAHAGGWESDAAAEGADGAEESSGGSRHELFTGLVIWASPAARQEWYEELFRLACWSYELFGHDLDNLGILAAGGVEARFVELQRDYMSRR
jgi:hypothetical protein